MPLAAMGIAMVNALASCGCLAARELPQSFQFTRVHFLPCTGRNTRNLCWRACITVAPALVTTRPDRRPRQPCAFSKHGVALARQAAILVQDITRRTRSTYRASFRGCCPSDVVKRFFPTPSSWTLSTCGRAIHNHYDVVHANDANPRTTTIWRGKRARLPCQELCRAHFAAIKQAL